MLAANKRAKKGKRYKPGIIEFNLDLEKNLLDLGRELREKTYSPGPYREFTVYEPKERLIQAAPYKDRVLHQWYVEEFIKPYFVPQFIPNSYACIEGKGMHKAADDLQSFMRKAQISWGEFWIIKCDVRKYFQNIDREILFSIINRKIGDPDVLWLTETILGSKDEVGIPIGNYTSQYFANIYLNQLDQYVFRKLKIRYYCRYMDDFVLIVPSKEKAKEVLENIRSFLWQELGLELNSKTQIFPGSQGVNFCGYKIWVHKKRIRDTSKRRMKRRLSALQIKYYYWEVDSEDIKRSLAGWRGFVIHADSEKLLEHISDKYVFVRGSRIRDGTVHAYSTNRLYRGGNYNNNGADNPVSYRNNNNPDNTNNNIGFRSALILKPEH